jgi:hypothetical protein
MLENHEWCRCHMLAQSDAGSIVLRAVKKETGDRPCNGQPATAVMTKTRLMCRFGMTIPS